MGKSITLPRKHVAKACQSSLEKPSTPKPMVSSRYIKKSTKNTVLSRQDYKCANKPESRCVASRLCDNTGNTVFYNCMLWKYRAGEFDEAGCQFDHIREFSQASRETMSTDIINGEPNIQALCHACHSVKTRAFAQCKQEIYGDVIAQGGQRMAVDI
jgi:hypothetical protein